MKKTDLESATRRRFADPVEVLQYASIAADGLSPYEEALLCRSYVPGQRVLDVGCGGGREAVPLARLGLLVVAMDFIYAMVQAARGHTVEKGQSAAFVVGDLAALPFRDASFDGVVMLQQVITHVPSRAGRIDVLRAARRILRPGGKLVVTTHNRRSHWKFQLYFAWANRIRRLARRLGYDGMLGDNDRWSARISQSSLGQPVFFHMYDLDEAVADLEAAGFEVLEAKTRSELEAGSSEPARRIKDYLLGFVARRPAD